MRRSPSFLVPSPAMAVAVVALLAACGGLALAAGSGGPVIRACANKKTGALRLASRCRHGERPVSWNQAGPQGARGPAGANGINGTDGTNGINGVNGATGFTSTLPRGQTETGTWGAFAAGKEAYASISFNIPLAAAPAAIVTEATPEPPKPPCAGTVAKPTAESGHLCIYLNTGNLEGSVGVFDPATGGEGAEAFGTLVRITNGPGKADGSWAVTG